MVLHVACVEEQREIDQFGREAELPVGSEGSDTADSVAGAAAGQDDAAASAEGGSCGCVGIGGPVQDGDYCRAAGAPLTPIKSRQVVHENCGEVFPWCAAQYGCHFQASSCTCGKLDGSVLDGGYIMLDEWDCDVVSGAPIEVQPCTSRPF